MELRRYCRRYCRLGFPPQEHDGTLWGGEKRLLRTGNLAVFFYLFYGSQHYGEGLGGSSFSLPKKLYRLIIGSIACQKKASQTLYGYNPALPEKSAGSHQRISFGDGLACTIDQLQTGAALWAGIRLGVEAAIQRVVILLLALGTHLEATHCGLGSVIRYVLNYGKAGSTVGAVSEGVEVTSVAGCQHFLEAGGTSGNIGGNELIFTSFGDAFSNLETLVANSRLTGSSDILNTGSRGSQRLQVSQKVVQGNSLTLHFNLYVLRGIAHPTLQIMLTGKLINKGAKADPLYHAPDANFHYGDIIKSSCLLYRS